MEPTVRFEPQHQEWSFGGQRRRYDGGDSLVIKRLDLPAATATDLARALRRARAADAEPEQVIIDLAPDDEYSPKETVGGPITFRLDADGVLLVELTFDSDTYVDDAADFDTTLRPLITPYLRRSRAILRRLEPDSERSTAPYFHRAGLAVPTRSRTLLDLYSIADDLADLIGAVQGGTLTLASAVDLVLGGHAHLLIGLPESSWLEVKAQHYDLAMPAGTISTAEAVSRFCNAEDGGVVIVGMDTSARSGVEVIRSVRPVPLDGKTARRYRQACENRLVPFPVGLRVETVPTGPGQGLVVLSVPPQPEELKPFLVHGVIVDGKVQGSFFSIVRRSGADSIPITAQQVHSTLAAGRALLRCGQFPGVS